ncbi:MAG: histidinol dehydrogenase [Pirellulales bacterium]|nr:histidinol dehydrogenase [Pirellulales bacterium]
MTLTIPRIDTRQDDAASLIAALREKLSPRGEVVSDSGRQRTFAVFGEALSPAAVVARICDDVRDQGLSAALRYSQLLDQAQLSAQSLRVKEAELQQAHAAASPAFLTAIRNIRQRIWQFQSALLPRDVRVPAPHGGELRHCFLPLRRVGVCVPGGAAAYPSTVLMTVVPALAAGVEEIAVIAPPTPFGSYNTDLLATCHELGVTEVYRLGGAQGVAALAYGLAGTADGSGQLTKVDKIVGPGNLFVALAKRRVYGEVDIDSIAGPSEVVVIADKTTPVDQTVADMLAQAEHSPGASILITWHAPLLDAITAELDRQCRRLSRGELTRQALADYGALILVRDAAEACAVANDIAPEHLHIACAHAEQLVPHIPHAGAVFVGPHSPVALGDYAAGPSHVLPTSGTARWASGLSALQFLRTKSVIQYTAEGLAAVADDIRALADKEGLTAHRYSVDVRVGEM